MELMNLLQESTFYQIAAILTLAAFGGFIGLLLRQPMIVSFIAVGILIGPSGLNLIQSKESIDLLAKLGIAVLLFLVGLKLDLKLVRTMGKVSVATGLGQVFFTAFIGFFIGLGLGLDTITSIYVAVALTFSSTIIIVKLLSDKKEVDSLHGRIAIGFLIVQDLVVVLAMMVLSAFGIGAQEEGGAGIIMQVGMVLVYGALMLALVGLFIRYLATPLVRRIAHSPELLITFAIAWAALLAVLGDHFGFSKELGGLLAGVSLASTPFREAIVARLSSLRDFLLLFFFIALGAQLDLSLLGAQIGPALVFSAFVLIGNPLIVMVILGIMGYRKRTGFLAGLTVAQISEFSLIFIAMGLSLGHVTGEALGLVTLVGLITIALSVYVITYSHTIYEFIAPWLSPFEKRHADSEHSGNQAVSRTQYDVILFGIGRFGDAIAREVLSEGKKLLAVDFNPESVRGWRARGLDAMYGDASDPDFLSQLPLDSAEWVISALPQLEAGVVHEDPRLTLIEGLKAAGYKGHIAVATHKLDEVAQLEAKGAELVLLPFQDAASKAVRQILQ